jgi:hypothetical protein
MRKLSCRVWRMRVHGNHEYFDVLCLDVFETRSNDTKSVSAEESRPSLTQMAHVVHGISAGEHDSDNMPQRRCAACLDVGLVVSVHGFLLAKNKGKRCHQPRVRRSHVGYEYALCRYQNLHGQFWETGFLSIVVNSCVACGWKEEWPAT